MVFLIECGLMSDQGFTFEIDGYTPQTIGFGRLVEYYHQLAKMLGDTDGVHLSEIFESSHGNAFQVDAGLDMGKRLGAIQAGTAHADAIRAQRAIDAMLAEDGTSARIRDVSGAVIIPFPGRSEPPIAQLEVFDSGIVGGKLYRMLDKGDAVSVGLRELGGRKIMGSAPHKLAKRLRDYMFEDVRLYGRGRWRRDEQGSWIPKTLEFYEFDPVEPTSLREAVSALRAVEADWPEDALGELAKLNEQEA